MFGKHDSDRRSLGWPPNTEKVDQSGARMGIGDLQHSSGARPPSNSSSPDSLTPTM